MRPQQRTTDMGIQIYPKSAMEKRVVRGHSRRRVPKMDKASPICSQPKIDYNVYVLVLWLWQPLRPLRSVSNSSSRFLALHSMDDLFLHPSRDPTWVTGGKTWIGGGNGGKVFRTTNVNGTAVALKEALDGSDALDNLRKEITILQRVRHHNIIEYFGAQESMSRMYVLFFDSLSHL